MFFFIRSTKKAADIRYTENRGYRGAERRRRAMRKRLNFTFIFLIASAVVVILLVSGDDDHQMDEMAEKYERGKRQFRVQFRL